MFCCPFTILDGDFPLFPVPRIQKRSVNQVSLGHPYQTLRIYQRGNIFSIIWKYGNILFKYRLYSILLFFCVLPCYCVLSIFYSPISKLSETYPHNSPMIPPCLLAKSIFDGHIPMWRFPKVGVPPSHQYSIGFSMT